MIVHFMNKKTGTKMVPIGPKEKLQELLDENEWDYRVISLNDDPSLNSFAVHFESGWELILASNCNAPFWYAASVAQFLSRNGYVFSETKFDMLHGMFQNSKEQSPFEVAKRFCIREDFLPGIEYYDSHLD